MTLQTLLVELGLDDDRFTRGIQRAVASTERFGRAASTAAASGVERFRTALDRVGAFAASAALSIGVASAAVSGIGVALGAAVERGGRFADVAQAFATAFGDQERALAGIRSTTQGLVNDLDLMTSANQALQLGAVRTSDEFARLAGGAVRLGRALGVDAGRAIDTLVTGIGRQSALMVDNLGIIVDAEGAYKAYAATLGTTAAALDDVQRKEAFRAAALEQLEAKVSALGAAEVNAATALAQFRTQLANLRDEFALFLARTPAIEAFFSGLALRIGGREAEFRVIGDAVRNSLAGVPNTIESLSQRLNDATIEAARLRAELGEFADLADKDVRITLNELAETELPLFNEIRKGRDDLAQVNLEVQILRDRLQALRLGGGAAGPAGGGGLPQELEQTVTKMQAALRATDAWVSLFPEFDAGAAKLEILESGLRSLIDQGLSPATALAKELADRIKTLRQIGTLTVEFEGIKGLEVAGGDLLTGFEGFIDLLAETAVTMDAFEESIDDAEAALRELRGFLSRLFSSVRGTAGRVLDPTLIVSNLASGAISSLISSLIAGIVQRGDAPNEAQLAAARATEASIRALEANTDALDRLRRAQRADVFTAPLEAILEAIQAAEFFGGGVGFNLLAFEAALERLGLTFADFERVLEALGLTADFTTEGIEQLKEALDFAIVDQQLARLKQSFELLDITDPLEQFEQLREFLLTKLAGPLRDIVAGLDATDLTGFFEELLKQLAEKTFDFEQLEGIGLQQFLDILAQMERLGDAAATATSSFAGQLDLLRREFDLLDIDDPVARFERLRELLLQFVTGDLAVAIQNLDAADPGAFLEELLRQIRTSTFNFEDLEGISLTELLDLLSEMERLGDAAATAAEAMEQMTDELLNVPTGFKTALEIFRATIVEAVEATTPIRPPTGLRPPGGGPAIGPFAPFGPPSPPVTSTGVPGSFVGAGGGGPTFQIQSVQVSGVQDLNNLYRQLSTVALRSAARGGAPVIPVGS